MKIPSQDVLRDILHYDINTGVFTWKHRDRRYFSSKRGFSIWNAQHAGRKANNTRRDGYDYINIFNKRYLAHRVAFMYMLGWMPEEVDHSNQVKSDNRWINLKSSSRKINAKNLPLFLNNTSGYAGVSWSKQKGKWRSRAHLSGKDIHFGFFDDIEDAAKARADGIKRLKFDNSHGLENSRTTQRRIERNKRDKVIQQ